MARSVTNILQTIITVVKKGGGDKEAIKGLAEIKKVAGDVAMVAGVVAAAWYTVDKVLDATVGTFVAYADEVERVMNITGASAEEASKLIQTADDLGISIETVTKSLQFMAKNGLDPTIDGLAQLADQYVALAPGQERTAFLFEKMGKSGGDMAKLLKLGGEGVREWAASIDGALVLTEESIRKAHEYELAQDALNDSWTEFKVGVGEALTPTLTGLLNHINALNEADKRLAEEGVRPGTQAYFDRRLELVEGIKTEQEQQNALRETAAAMDELGLSEEELKAAQEQLKDEMDALNLLISGPVGDGIDDHVSKLDELRSKEADLQAQLAALTKQGYGPQSEKIKDVTSDLADNAAAIDKENAAWRENARQIVFNLAQRQILASNLTEAQKSQVIAGMAEQFGLIDENTEAALSGIGDVIGQLEDGEMATKDAVKALEGYANKLAEIDGTEVTVTINQVLTTQGDLDLINQGVPPTVINYKSSNRAIATGAAALGGGSTINYISVENLYLSGDKLSVGAFLRELGLAITL